MNDPRLATPSGARGFVSSCESLCSAGGKIWGRVQVRETAHTWLASARPSRMCARGNLRARRACKPDRVREARGPRSMCRLPPISTSFASTLPEHVKKDGTHDGVAATELADICAAEKKLKGLRRAARALLADGDGARRRDYARPPRPASGARTARSLRTSTPGGPMPDARSALASGFAILSQAARRHGWHGRHGRHGRQAAGRRISLAAGSPTAPAST